MEAFGLPKTSNEEQEHRKQAIEEATLHAIEVPFEVMATAFAGFEIAEAMTRTGNPNSVSDAGVGALALQTCMEGAWLNVRINAVDLKEHPRVKVIEKEGKELIKKSLKSKDHILEQVVAKIGA